MVRQRFLELLQAGERGEILSSSEILYLLSTGCEEEQEILLRTADRVRQKFVGDEIHLRGIVEFSNVCVQNCAYCGLQRDNDQIRRYRMTPAEVVEVAKKGESRGLRTLVLQSGEDPWFTRQKLSVLIREIKCSTGLTVTLSVGERPWVDYEEWKKAGADRYLLKQETASPALFQRFRPGRKLEDRLNSLGVLRKLGYEVGSGNIVGLPGQSEEDLARDIQFFFEYDFDMIGIGPFIPHPQTPLAGATPGDLPRALKVLALTRIMTKNTNLPATTAAGVLDPDGRRKALQAGANVMMPDITPWAYRQHYQIYPGKAREGSEENKVIALIFDLGRRIGPGAGPRALT